MNEKRELESISWKVIEEVAGLLEKSLAPSAKVCRNVLLPVIGKSRKRQCDIVITCGLLPRQTVSIVEVQKRTRKPDINTFHGWCRKMQEVGAQHLICVSTKGYPKSIVDEVANTYGPMVRLLTLNEMRQPEMPGLTIIRPFIIHKKPKFKLEAVGPKVKLEGYREEKVLHLNTADKVFTIDDSTEFKSINELTVSAMNEVANSFHQENIEEPDRYHVEMTLGSKDKELWLHIKGKPYKVMELPTRICIETEVSTIPLQSFEYHQESIDGALAWVAVAEGMSGNKPISVRLVFGKDAQGLLRRVSIYQRGVQSVGLVVSTRKSDIESYVQRSLGNSSA